MKSKKNLLFLSLFTLVLGLSGCFLTDSAHAAKNQTVKGSQAVAKKVKGGEPNKEKPNIMIVIKED